MSHRDWKVGSVAVLSMLFLTVSAWAARPESFTTIDVPAAKVTVASGINGDGFIVGWYCLQLPCNAAHFRGFLRDVDGTLHDIVIPSDADHPAIGTQARYITPQGLVIGDYTTLEQGATLSNPRFRGFACLLASCYGPKAQFTYFDAPPDAVYDNPSAPHSIIPRAMSANGDLVGCIHDQNQGDSMHGFYMHDGVFTRLADSMTMNNGVSASGDIVGLDGGNTTAYHIDAFGNAERLAFPDADATNAWDINSKGEIVGQALTNNFAVGHAFLRGKNGDYRFIDPAGALSAVAFAIAANGNIVGQYRDSSGTHGFLFVRGEDER